MNERIVRVIYSTPSSQAVMILQQLLEKIREQQAPASTMETMAVLTSNKPIIEGNNQVERVVFSK